MNKVLLFALMMVAGVASAVPFDPDYIRRDAPAVSPISVSSSTATEIDTTARKAAGRFLLFVDNEGADSVRCAFANTVTKTTNGFLIRPGSPFSIKITENMSMWCVAVGTTTVPVTLLQGAN